MEFMALYNTKSLPYLGICGICGLIGFITANEICKFSVSEASVMNILIFEPVLRVLLLSCRFCRAQMTHCVNGNSTAEQSIRASAVPAPGARSSVWPAVHLKNQPMQMR